MALLPIVEGKQCEFLWALVWLVQHCIFYDSHLFKWKLWTSAVCFFVLHPLLFSQFRLFKPRRKSRIARYNILKIICRPINKNAKWIMTSSSTHTNISVHDQQRFHAQYKRSLQFKFRSPYSFESYCNGQVLDRGHMYTLNSISRLISREWQTRTLVNGNIVKVVLPPGRNVT